MLVSSNTTELLLSDFSHLQSEENHEMSTSFSLGSAISHSTAAPHPDPVSILPKSSAPEFDVILRTTDNVRFLAHEDILRFASTDARAIFASQDKFVSPSSSAPTLMQESSVSAPCSAESTVMGSKALRSGSQYPLKDAIYVPDDLPVYRVEISSSTLKFILNTLYPTAPPLLLPGISLDGTVSDPALVYRMGDAVMMAAVRYSMPKVLAVWSMKLLHVVNTIEGAADTRLPLQVYVIACRFGLADVARSAAHACLKGKGFEKYTVRLEHIRADAYFKLLDYRRKAIQAVMEIMDEDKAAQSTVLFVNSRSLLITCEECGSSTEMSSTPIAEWWQRFALHAIMVLREAPGSRKIFDIAFLSPVFSRARNCKTCSVSFCLKWSKVQHALQKDIAKAIDSISLDMSCLNQRPGTCVDGIHPITTGAW